MFAPVVDGSLHPHGEAPGRAAASLGTEGAGRCWVSARCRRAPLTPLRAALLASNPASLICRRRGTLLLFLRGLLLTFAPFFPSQQRARSPAISLPCICKASIFSEQLRRVVRPGPLWMGVHRCASGERGVSVCCRGRCSFLSFPVCCAL